MLDPILIDATCAAADDNGMANDVTATAGNPFTLAANDSGDSLAHFITITPSGSVTGDYTVTGTGPNGEAQTETVATDTVNAVTSTKYFLTVTEVLAPSGIGSETVDIGWAVNAVTPWQTVDPRVQYLSFGCRVVTGSPNFTVQSSMDPAGGDAYSHASVTSKTADTASNFPGPIQAVRLLFAAAGRVRFSGLPVCEASN